MTREQLVRLLPRGMPDHAVEQLWELIQSGELHHDKTGFFLNDGGYRLPVRFTVDKARSDAQAQ